MHNEQRQYEDLQSDNLESQPRARPQVVRSVSRHEERLMATGSNFFRSYGFFLLVVIGMVLFAAKEMYSVFVTSEPMQARSTRQPAGQLAPVANPANQSLVPSATEQSKAAAALAQLAPVAQSAAVSPQTLSAPQNNYAAQAQPNLAATSQPAPGMAQSANAVVTTPLGQVPTQVQQKIAPAAKASTAPNLSLVLDDLKPKPAQAEAAPMVLDAAARKEREAMQSQINNMDQRLHELQKMMGELKQSIVSLKQPKAPPKIDLQNDPVIKNLQKQLLSVQHQMAQIPFVVNGQGQNVTSSVTSAPRKNQPSSMTTQGYGLEAVIPGRAWVTTPSGVLLTVALGDEIDDLGQVITIDSVAGAVVTNRGHVIKESTP